MCQRISKSWHWDEVMQGWCYIFQGLTASVLKTASRSMHCSNSGCTCYCQKQAFVIYFIFHTKKIQSKYVVKNSFQLTISYTSIDLTLLDVNSFYKLYIVLLYLKTLYSTASITKPFIDVASCISNNKLFFFILQN